MAPMSVGCIDIYGLGCIKQHGARATCKGIFVVPITNFTIEITNLYIYDFGPKAMLSNAGL